MIAPATRDESAENGEKRIPSDVIASLPKNLKSKDNRLFEFIKKQSGYELQRKS